MFARGMPARWVLLVVTFAALGAWPAQAADDEPATPAPVEELADDAPIDDGPMLDIRTPEGGRARVDVVGERTPAPRAPVIDRGAGILGTAPTRQRQASPPEVMKTIPGSALVLDSAALNRLHRSDSIQEALRAVPGIHVRDEQSNGVVPNIGIRGLNPDRSEGLLVLEDGVFASFAPYIVNAAYYTPPFERIHSMELVKGAGQILYGPHTVGGVLNLITTPIPTRPSGLVRLTGGSDGYLSGYARYGATSGRFGYLLEVVHKSGDGYRDGQDYDIQNLNAKFRYTFSRATDLTVKLGYYDQETHETYLGLTQSMFDANPQQNPAQLDTYNVEWYDSYARVRHEINRCWELTTTVYAAGGSRDWNRQDFARNTNGNPAPGNTASTLGDLSIDGGAIYLRDSFGSRDRDTYRLGVESRLKGRYRLFGRTHEIQVGARYHFEDFDNERNNRATLTAAPVTRDRENQQVHAISGFVQNDFEVTKRLHVIAGARVEHYTADRHITRQGNADVDIRGETKNTEVIPGLGVTYDLGRDNTVFAGVHRGFAPPRVSDAINNTGDDLQLEAELSWNYELGVRGAPTKWMTYEATAFFLDFENQVVPANESGGASTANTNAGETQHYGLELALSADLLQLTRRTSGHRCDPRLMFDLSATYVETENTTRGGTFEGNELPYAPNFVGRIGLVYEQPKRFSIGVSAAYVGEQFSDQANTVAGTNDGTAGVIEDNWVFDVTARYRIPRTRLTIIGSVNNVLDDSFIASRAPQGIFAGPPRRFFLGLEAEF